MNDATICWYVSRSGATKQCKTYPFVVSLTSNFKFNLSVGPVDTVCMIDPWQQLSLISCCDCYLPSPLMRGANLGYFHCKVKKGLLNHRIIRCVNVAKYD